MKKLIAIAIGLGLVLGTVSFAQEVPKGLKTITEAQKVAAQQAAAAAQQAVAAQQAAQQAAQKAAAEAAQKAADAIKKLKK